MINNIIKIFFLISILSLSFCAKSLFRDQKHDSSIEKKLSKAVDSKFSEFKNDLNIIVYDHSVLLTGTVPTNIAKNQIATYIANENDISKVYDELEIGVYRNFTQISADVILKQSIYTRLVTHSKILARNFDFDVVNGKVYIIGWARNKEEHDKVVSIIKEVPGVKRVVTYIKEIK